MKVQVLSDLHLEFQDFTPPQTDADVVVLAGDIHLKEKGVAWALKTFDKPVVYVAGNHEYYGGSLGHTFAKMREATKGTHVHLLQDSSVVLDGVRFLGATLWTDFRLTGNEPLAMWDAQQTMNDYRKVRDELFRKVRPYQLAARHARSRNFLEGALQEPFEGATVVVTHHAPSERSLHERYRSTPSHLNSSYASRLDHLMGSAALWVHGHTHDSFSYDNLGTRVVCNPRGYAPSDLNPDFNPGLVLTV